jgi:hypothetical protein
VAEQKSSGLGYEMMHKTQTWQPLAFMAIGLLLHALLYTTYAGWVGASHRVREIDARWLDDDRDVNLLVLGGSHARNAADPSLMSQSMSLAVGGEHYVKTLYRMRYLYAQRPRNVRAALVPLDAAGLSSWKTDTYTPEYIWGRYVDFVELGGIRKMPFAYGRMWTKATLVPYAGELETLEQLWLGSRAFQDERQTLAPPPKSERRTGQEAAEDHLAGHDLADPTQIWALRQLVSELRARQTRVILVTYPVSAGYSKTARELGADMSAQRKLVAELSSPGQVDHLDFENLLHGKPEHFYDGDHLSRSGRVRFSRLLRQKLLALGIRQ